VSTPAWLIRQAGLTRAISFTLLGRVWSVIVGLVTIVFIGRYLTPAAQGYYYTFTSLIALQVFVELGLTYAIVQFASHEMAHLEWQPDGTVDGPARAKQRLRSLLNFSMAWFGVAAFVMAAVLIPLGWLIAGFDPGARDSRGDIMVPWFWLVALSSGNLLVTAAMSMIEGCGHVVHMALLRLLQSLIAALAAWAVLAGGGALLALVAQAAAMLAIAAAWLTFAYRAFFSDLLSFRSDVAGMNWRHEIWPFHWRIAVSWASGYLIFQLFSPLLFATHGPVAAGQMGLSLQVIGALNGVAMAWISTKAPLYGRMVARHEGKALDQLFFRGLAQSSAVLLACLAAALAGLWTLEEMGSPLAQRVVPLPLMAWMAAISMANHVVFAQAAVLRAHKQDPFMVLSAINGVATGLLALALIPVHGLGGAVASYGVSAMLIGLGGGTAIFLRKRTLWWLNDVHP
jgi:O-antigen/teichoic acid export membrane protein